MNFSAVGNVILSVYLLVSGTGLAAAQQASPPTVLTKRNASSAPPGFDSKRLAIIDLGPEIDAMQGYGLRLSRVTVAPGAAFGAHSHKGQPEIIYVVDGTLTEERDGANPVDHPAGSVLVMTKDVTHALSNRTARPTVYIGTSVKP